MFPFWFFNPNSIELLPFRLSKLMQLRNRVNPHKHLVVYSVLAELQFKNWY